jgi:hypothetical protein
MHYLDAMLLSGNPVKLNLTRVSKGQSFKFHPHTTTYSLLDMSLMNNKPVEYHVHTQEIPLGEIFPKVFYAMTSLTYNVFVSRRLQGSSSPKVLLFYYRASYKTTISHCCRPFKGIKYLYLDIKGKEF